LAVNLQSHFIRLPRLARALGDKQLHDLTAQQPLLRGRILTDNPTIRGISQTSGRLNRRAQSHRPQPNDRLDHQRARVILEHHTARRARTRRPLTIDPSTQSDTSLRQANSLKRNPGMPHTPSRGRNRPIAENQSGAAVPPLTHLSDLVPNLGWPPTGTQVIGPLNRSPPT
jgi:hypothetical protein